MALAFSCCLLGAEYISVAFSLAGKQSQAAQHVWAVSQPLWDVCVILQIRCSVGLSIRPKQGIQKLKSGHHRLHT